jgi:hypothetical protein
MAYAQTKESIAAESYVDVNGVLRWTTNDRVPFGDVLSIFFGGDIDAIVRSNAARDAENAAFIAEYRKEQARETSKQRAERMAEMRAAFGSDTEVVDVISGRRYKL